MIDDLATVIAELSQRHPRFPPDTVARLVCRVAAHLDQAPDGDHDQAPDLSRDRVAVVRQVTEQQLAYVEQIPAVGLRASA
jgi:hypothetical protein